VAICSIACVSVRVLAGKGNRGNSAAATDAGVLFSLIWTVGATGDTEGRAAFDAFFRCALPPPAYRPLWSPQDASGDNVTHHNAWLSHKYIAYRQPAQTITCKRLLSSRGRLVSI